MPKFNDAIIVNHCALKSRVALIEGGRPVEVWVEGRQSVGAGDIYCGRVVRVLPGIQAAFVDIGLERTGFLYVNDAMPEAVERKTQDPTTDASETQIDHRAPVADISSVLTVGQILLVQITKEPIGTKGARLTRHLSLPGRFVVLCPFSTEQGISKRITSESEQARLRAVLSDVAPVGMGAIARTASREQPDAVLHTEIQSLLAVWQQLQTFETAKKKRVGLVRAELTASMRIIRDQLTETVTHVMVDDHQEVANLTVFVESFAPEWTDKIQFYKEPEPIFDYFGVEKVLQRALKRYVNLPGGGSLVFDQAEALTVVDVNSGRAVKHKNVDETFLKTNLEAAEMIAYQLRLRNVGGMILIDFIDMTEADHIAKVLDCLEKALQVDRARTTLLELSEIGVLQMTRKRVRESLSDTLMEPCPYCKGRSRVKSATTMVDEVRRAVDQRVHNAPKMHFEINVASDVANAWKEQAQTTPSNAEVVGSASLHREQYDIIGSPLERPKG